MHLHMAFSLCIRGICVHRKEISLEGLGGCMLGKRRGPPLSLATLNSDGMTEQGGWHCAVAQVLNKSTALLRHNSYTVRFNHLKYTIHGFQSICQTRQPSPQFQNISVPLKRSYCFFCKEKVVCTFEETLFFCFCLFFSVSLVGIEMILCPLQNQPISQKACVFIYSHKIDFNVPKVTCFSDFWIQPHELHFSYQVCLTTSWDLFSLR